MEIKQISYQRVKNLGNYESERMEMVAELDQDDDPLEQAEYLKMLVTKALGLFKEVDLDQDLTEKQPNPF